MLRVLLLFRVTVALAAHVVIEVAAVDRGSPRRHRQLSSQLRFNSLNFISHLTFFLGTLLTWHCIHVIKHLAIDANPVLLLGLPPSNEQLPGAGGVTDAAALTPAEHALALFDAIENDLVHTVNLDRHHLHLSIDGGTWRTALNLRRA